MCLYTEQGLANGATMGAAQAANLNFGVQALSLGAGFLGQSISARRAAREQERAVEANRESAIADANRQYRVLSERQFQEEQAAAAEIEAIRREAARTASRASLAAIESGTSGSSVEAVLDQVTADELSYQQGVLANLEFTDARLALERESVGEQAENRITQFRLSPVTQPNLLSLGIGLGSAYLDGYSRYGLFKPQARRPISGGGTG